MLFRKLVIHALPNLIHEAIALLFSLPGIGRGFILLELTDA